MEDDPTSSPPRRSQGTRNGTHPREHQVVDGNPLQVQYPLSLNNSRDCENIEIGSPPGDSVECENGDDKYMCTTRTPAVSAKEKIALYSSDKAELDIPGTYKQVGFTTFFLSMMNLV